MRLLVLVFILISGAANAGEKPCCMFNAKLEQMLLYVDVEPAEDPYNQPNFLTFRILPKQDFGETTLEFLFTIPNGGWISHPVYKLHIGGQLLGPEYIRRDEIDPFAFKVSVPDVAALETIQFSIGWYGAEFPDYEVDFMFHNERNEMPYFGSWERAAMKGYSFNR